MATATREQALQWCVKNLSSWIMTPNVRTTPQGWTWESDSEGFYLSPNQPFVTTITKQNWIDAGGRGLVVEVTLDDMAKANNAPTTRPEKTATREQALQWCVDSIINWPTYSDGPKITGSATIGDIPGWTWRILDDKSSVLFSTYRLYGFLTCDNWIDACGATTKRAWQVGDECVDGEILLFHGFVAWVTDGTNYMTVPIKNLKKPPSLRDKVVAILRDAIDVQYDYEDSVDEILALIQGDS